MFLVIDLGTFQFNTCAHLFTSVHIGPSLQQRLHLIQRAFSDGPDHLPGVHQLLATAVVTALMRGRGRYSGALHADGRCGVLPRAVRQLLFDGIKVESRRGAWSSRTPTGRRRPRGRVLRVLVEVRGGGHCRRRRHGAHLAHHGGGRIKSGVGRTQADNTDTTTRRIGLA